MAHPHASETQPNGPIPTRPDDLTIGMYVDLNCSWFRHPFASKTFTITSDKELTIIRGLGLDTVLVHPARSDSEGAPQNSHNDGDGRTTAAPTLPDTTGPDTVRCDTPAPPPTIVQYKESLQQANMLYRQTVAESSQALNDIKNGSESGLVAAKQMIHGLTEILVSDNASSAMGSLLGAQELDDLSVLHAMNVAVLSMLVGRQFDLGHEAMHALGTAGFLHDIGEQALSPDLRHRSWASMNTEDQKAFQQHVDFGLNMLAQFPGLPDDVLSIIRNHHERVDGSGYPARIRGDQLSLLSRIHAVVDEYESLVNTPDPLTTMTPTETLSKLYTNAKTKFSEEVVVGLIQTLSVYPPGTVVALTDHSVGLVVSINLHSRMRPLIVLYDPTVNQANPHIADLSKDPTLSIVRSIPRSELSQETSDYLNLTKWTGFFISSSLKTLEEDRAA